MQQQNPDMEQQTPEKGKRRIVLPIILGVFLLIAIIVGVFAIRHWIDQMHEKERIEYMLHVDITANANYAPPGETITFTVSATGGKGELTYEFISNVGGKVTVLQEASSDNTIDLTFEELGHHKISVIVSDESQWTADVSDTVTHSSYIEGVDVSRYQLEIDWAALKRQDVSFAMIRSSYGQEQANKDQTDPLFAANIAGAKAADIKIGIYHFCYALTPEEAVKEAEFCLKTIEPYRDIIDFPVVLDLETTEQVLLTQEEVEEIITAFCETIAEAGYTPMLYTFDNWLIDLPDSDPILKYDLWIANWSNQPAADYEYDIWQYSSEGQLEGLETTIDLNYAFCDYTAGIKTRTPPDAKTQ